MCMTLAPASNAALASRAICSGVTGTWCCLGSVSTPFNAQVMTALSLMKPPCLARGFDPAATIMGTPAADYLRPAAIARSRPSLAKTVAVEHAGIAAVDREIARARKDGARLQAIEPPDRMAEMSRVGVADTLRQMRQVDIFVDEVEQMPRPLPGPESAE